MYILILSTHPLEVWDCQVLTYADGCDTLKSMGDVFMKLGLLVGYIASGFCFLIVLFATVVGLPSLCLKKGFFVTTLGVLLMMGSFAFPYMLGRGGF